MRLENLEVSAVPIYYPNERITRGKVLINDDGNLIISVDDPELVRTIFHAMSASGFRGLEISNVFSGFEFEKEDDVRE